MFSPKSLLLGLALGALLGFLGARWMRDSEPVRPDTQGPSPPTVAPERTFTGALSRPHAVTPESLKGSLSQLETSSTPLLRTTKLTQLGYEAAGVDPDNALQKLGAIRDVAGKVAFVQGLFTRIAEDKPPYEAIQRVKRLERSLEIEGFKALVSQWTGEVMLGKPSFADFYTQLLSSPDVSTDIKDAWLKAYQGHSGRSAMLAEVAGSRLQQSPDDALALGEELTGWEREHFHNKLAERWMATDSTGAWEWLMTNRDEVSSETLAKMLDQWHGADPNAATDVFETLTDPQERLEASALLGARKATQDGTEKAIDWANSLPTAAEQDAAHEAIYQATPRGIGAILSNDEGSLSISGTLPGTPAAEAGLRQGDRIVQVDPGDGQFQELDASSLQSAVDLIRGEAGSSLRLRVLRMDGRTEVIDLNRQQLVFDGEKGRSRP